MVRLIHPATGVVVEVSAERSLALDWPPAPGHTEEAPPENTKTPARPASARQSKPKAKPKAKAPQTDAAREPVW